MIPTIFTAFLLLLSVSFIRLYLNMTLAIGPESPAPSAVCVEVELEQRF